jgi:transposase
VLILAMKPEELFNAALGLSGGWKVVRCEFDGSPKSLRLWLDFAPGTRFAPPGQADLCEVHDTVQKEWRHLNFFQYETTLHARVPRVWAKDGKVVQVEVPWARPGSGFTLLFEAMAMLLCEQMPVSDAAELLQEQDTRLWRVVMHYVEEAQGARDWSQVKRLMVDETSAKRGHRYVSCFADVDTRELLFMVEGKGNEVFAAFCQDLPNHGATAEQIALVCMDMSPAFKKGAKDFFPEAEIVFDHFHIMQLAGKALDEVRKELQREGHALKTDLWALRGNENSRTPEQVLRRRELCRLYPKLGRAMALRETLQDILADEDQESLRWWIRRAKVSRLQPFRDLAFCVKENWDGIVAFMKTRVTNGVMEAINGLLQLAKRSARGFRSFRYFQTMAYLKAGKLKLNLPKLSPT